MIFAIKKIAGAFLTPPGLFVLILLAACAGKSVKARRFAGAGALLMAVFIWVCSLSPVARMLTAPLEAMHPIPADPRGDVIVVLGGTVYSRAPDIGGEGGVSGDTANRLMTAARLYFRLKVPVIATGGPVYEGQGPTGEVYKKLLTQLGVARRDVITEEKSKDTGENAENTVRLLKTLGFKKPVLVTSAVHMPRAVACFNRLGQTVVPAASGATVQNSESGVEWADFLPGNMEKTSAAIHEYLGLAWLAMGGGP